MTLRSIFAFATMALATSSLVAASNSHGQSRFGISPTHSFHATHATNFDEKNKYCREEYGQTARMLDLAELDGEFANPNDLKHALNPLFDHQKMHHHLQSTEPTNEHFQHHEYPDNDPVMFYVADHGKDFSGTNAMLDRHEKYVLTKQAKHVSPQEHPDSHHHKQVADDIYLDVQHDSSVHQAPVLCYIPKPQYMLKKKQSKQSGSSGSSSSSHFPALFILCLAAAGVVGYKKWRASFESEEHGVQSTVGGYLPVSYSMLTSSDLISSAPDTAAVGFE